MDLPFSIHQVFFSSACFLLDVTMVNYNWSRKII